MPDTTVTTTPAAPEPAAAASIPTTPSPETGTDTSSPADVSAPAEPQDVTPGSTPKPTTPPETKKTPTETQPAEKTDGENAPITDWAKFTPSLPDGATVDPDVMAGFGKTAVSLGLSPKQANTLIQFQLDAIAQAREKLLQSGGQELTREWGAKTPENQKAVLTFITNVDRALGNDSFSKALEACGATYYPAIVRGMLTVSRMLSEDNMGRSGAAAQPVHEESAFEGIGNVLKEQRMRR